MGYTLHAFIAQRGTFNEYKSLGERITVVHINDQLDLLLNDKYLRQGLNLQNTEDPEGFEHWLLTKDLIQIFREKSKLTPIAYVNIDYFGGVGSQEAVVWRDGKEVLKTATEVAPRGISYGPANEALRLLGVKAQENSDEFDTAGLSRKRQMEDWFEEATGIHWMKYLEE